MALISNMEDKMEEMGKEMERLQRETRRDFVAQEVQQIVRDPYVEECLYPEMTVCHETVCPEVSKRAYRGRPGFVASLRGKVRATRGTSSRSESRGKHSFLDEQEGMEVEDLHETRRKTITFQDSIFEGLEEQQTLYGSRDYREVERERREKEKEIKKKAFKKGFEEKSKSILSGNASGPRGDPEDDSDEISDEDRHPRRRRDLSGQQPSGGSGVGDDDNNDDNDDDSSDNNTNAGAVGGVRRRNRRSAHLI
jgi:hypothetical protein